MLYSSVGGGRRSIDNEVKLLDDDDDVLPVRGLDDGTTSECLWKPEVVPRFSEAVEYLKETVERTTDFCKRGPLNTVAQWQAFLARAKAMDFKQMTARDQSYDRVCFRPKITLLDLKESSGVAQILLVGATKIVICSTSSGQNLVQICTPYTSGCATNP